MARARDGDILAADYHRNGVGGAGFYVALVQDQGRRMLVVHFPSEDEDGEVGHGGYTAVLDTLKLAAGNIYMHPRPDVPGSGDNAWRGDQYERRYAKAIIAKVAEDREATLARWRGEVD